MEPCTGLQYAGLSPIGEAYAADNGAIGIDNLQRLYQINEGKVGSVGQAFNLYLNRRLTPFIWSVMRFDASGHLVQPVAGLDTDGLSIYSTFAILTGGNFLGDTVDLISTVLQSDIETFVSKNESYFYRGPK